MVAKEGSKNCISVGLLKLYKQLTDCFAVALLDCHCDASASLSAGKEEKAVASALVVAVDRVVIAYPSLADDVSRGLDLFSFGVQPGKEINIALQVSGVIACNSVETEAVDVAIFKPEAHDFFDLLAHVLTVKVEVGHTAPELSLV